MADLSPGSVFAGHRIEGVAGRGGMGVVYRATHLALDHVVALKVISPKLAGDPRFRRRFADECRHAVRLHHPNVVRIHHAGEEAGLLFVTMDLIEGTDLRGVLNREDALEVERSVEIVAQVASALDAAHALGLVHRDIKPGNVMIEERAEGERVYLTDFGLARHVEATSGVTATGAFVGTLDYVAPEQIQGERVDARADVYSLACVLFELLTANPPFASREDKIEKMYAHLRDEPPRLRVMRPEVPGELDFAVSRALEKDPAARFPSAGDFARAAQAALEDEPTIVSERSVATGAAAPVEGTTVQQADDLDAADTPPPGEPPPSEPPGERPDDLPSGAGHPTNRRWIALVVLAAVAAAVIVLVLLLGGGDDDPELSATPTTPVSEEQASVDTRPIPEASILEPVPVPGFPVELAAGEGGIWVTSRDGRVSLVERDPLSGKSEARQFEVGDRPEGIAIGAGSIWVANGGNGQVLRLNPDGELEARIPVGGQPAGAAFAEGVAWVADAAGSRVFRVDPDDNSFSDVPVGESPHGIAAGKGSVWVVNRGSDDVTRLEPHKNSATVTAQIPVGSNPKGVALATGRVFVTNTDDAAVSVIDPAENEEMETVDAGDDPRGIVAFDNYVFVANGGGTVTRIDPRSLERVETIPDLPAGPEGITAGLGSLWVASGDADRVTPIRP